MKTYVRVNTDFDTVGQMHPRSIIWKDGRIFPISLIKERCSTDRGEYYTVVINGEERSLCYEAPRDYIPAPHGRWYVMSTESA